MYLSQHPASRVRRLSTVPGEVEGRSEVEEGTVSAEAAAGEEWEEDSGGE